MESNILVVDDRSEANLLMSHLLSGLGQVRFASDGPTALQQAEELPPDLVLLDAEMPGMTGYEVCEALKADPVLRDIPVIFVTAHGGTEIELKSFDVGAADFIVKPISGPLLVARVRTQLRIKHLTDELRRIAGTDALTELDNRRRFDEALAREWKRTLRTGHPISLLLVDVDNFKLFNDRYGHPAGDACLRSVAQVLRNASMRPADVVARHGGEEFAMLLPQTPRAGAEHLARRVLAAVESLGIRHEASPTARHVTVSIGVGSYDEASACWAEPTADSRFASTLPCSAGDLVHSADAALYAAKRAGRAGAWGLDIADVESPALAREIAPRNRSARKPESPKARKPESPKARRSVKHARATVPTNPPSVASIGAPRRRGGLRLRSNRTLRALDSLWPKSLQTPRDPAPQCDPRRLISARNVKHLADRSAFAATIHLGVDDVDLHATTHALDDSHAVDPGARLVQLGRVVAAWPETAPVPGVDFAGGHLTH